MEGRLVKKAKDKSPFCIDIAHALKIDTATAQYFFGPIFFTCPACNAERTCFDERKWYIVMHWTFVLYIRELADPDAVDSSGVRKRTSLFGLPPAAAVAQ